MSDEDPKITALRFNEAINRHDVDAVAALMTEDHLFVDSASSPTSGRDAMRAAWTGFFTAFSDYRNVVTTVSQRDDRIVLLGHSTCSEQALSGPAIWTARIRDGRVAEWRVYDDDPGIRRSLAIRAGGFDSGAVTPYLYYEDAGSALRWLCRVYGFVERSKETLRDESGTIFHAAVNAGAGVVLLGRPGDDYRNPKRLGQATQNLYVYVVDLDGHFERTKREGAEILSEIEHTHYGDRRYGSADLEGHHWYFAEKAERDPGGDAPTADDRDGHGRRE